MLATYGLRLVSQDDAEWLAVAISHQGLAGLFAHTHWAARSGASGVWSQSLRRIDHALTVAIMEARWSLAAGSAGLAPVAKGRGGKFSGDLLPGFLHIRRATIPSRKTPRASWTKRLRAKHQRRRREARETW